MRIGIWHVAQVGYREEHLFWVGLFAQNSNFLQAVRELLNELTLCSDLDVKGRRGLEKKDSGEPNYCPHLKEYVCINDTAEQQHFSPLICFFVNV